MSIEVKNEKEKVKSQIRDFLLKFKIPYEEDNDYMAIKGDLLTLEYFNEISLSLWFTKTKYLLINEFQGKLVLIDGKNKQNVLGIEKSDIYKIYYLSKTLYIRF